MMFKFEMGKNPIFRIISLYDVSDAFKLVNLNEWRLLHIYRERAEALSTLVKLRLN